MKTLNEKKQEFTVLKETRMEELGLEMGNMEHFDEIIELELELRAEVGITVGDYDRMFFPELYNDEM